MTVSTRDSTPYCRVKGRLDKLTTTKRGIMYCPGGIIGTEMSWASGGTDPMFPVYEKLMKAGYRMITTDDQAQWGNAAHQTRLTNMYTDAQSSLAFDTNKVNLFSTSGGAAPILNWAKNNLSKVQSIAMVVPSVDIIDIDTNNRVSVLGFDPVTQGPRSAYGGSTPPTSNNPVSNAASYAGIAIKIWYSDTDNVCLPATQTAFLSGVGSAKCTLRSLGSIGHAATGIDPNEVLAFFDTNG